MPAETWRGRAVMLVFWATSSEQSIHRLRQVEEQRRRVDAGPHGDRILMIAVHAPRFDHERDERHVRAEVARLGVGIPVVHDAKLSTWGLYQPDGWPTVVLVDHHGRAIGASTGRDDIELAAMVDQLMLTAADARRRRKDDQGPLPRPASSTRPPDHDLWFPTGVSRRGDRLAIVDRDRLRVFRMDSHMQHAEPLMDAFTIPGAARVAWISDQQLAVSQPDHGVVYFGSLDRLAEGRRLREGLDRPVGISLDADGSLVVADAGADQLVRITGERVGPIAGSGWSGHVNGRSGRAALSEPTSVVRLDRGLAFVDAGSNSVRLATDRGRVMTVAAAGTSPERLPEPGLIDGRAHRARLQRPSAAAVLPDGSLAIVDSGNHRLRLLVRRRVRTLPVTGLCYPTDVATDPVVDDRIIVADTHHHRIVVADPKLADAWALDLVH